MMSYVGCHDTEHKLNRFNNICGSVFMILINKFRKGTQMKFYKITEVPMPLYGSGQWITIRKQEHRILVQEMKLHRRVKGCTRFNWFRCV